MSEIGRRVASHGVGTPVPRLRSLRILIVEDEYFIAREMVAAVSALGGTVVGPARSHVDALHLVATEPVSAAVVDLNLQGVMAFPLVDELVRKGVPVVLATGYTRNCLPVRYQALRRWVKPYQPLAIALELKAICEEG